MNQTAADHIRGEDRLSTSPLDLVTCKPLSPSLFNLASATVRKCVCEGRSGTTSNKILVCESCLHSSCTACSGRPDHHYKLDDEERRSPDEFAKELKETLPMRFSLNGFDLAKSQQTVEALRVGGLPVNQLPLYLETVAAAVNSNDNEVSPNLYSKTRFADQIRAPVSFQDSHSTRHLGGYLHCVPCRSRTSFCRSKSGMATFRSSRSRCSSILHSLELC